MIKENIQIVSLQETIQNSRNNLAKHAWDVTLPIQQRQHLLFTNKDSHRIDFNTGSVSTPPLDDSFPVPAQTPLAKPKSNV